MTPSSSKMIYVYNHADEPSEHGQVRGRKRDESMVVSIRGGAAASDAGGAAVLHI